MKRWGIYFSLFLGLVLAFFAAQAPEKLESVTEFNDSSVLQIIETIAQKPHPLGTPEHDRVRDYVAQAYRNLGAQVEIETTTGLNQRGASYVAIAPVSNIIATLKSDAPKAPAILVMSHYDSVIHSPGAADDSLGVATALEIARAISMGPKLKRDIIFLVTDGEEAGLLGAQAFFANNPLKDHVGIVINMEARGDAGRVNMFETGPQNGGLIELYAKVVGTPSANSLSSLVYRLMPNGTDLTKAIHAKKAGLNFAMIGHENAYHTPLSTPMALSRNSVYHMGAQVFPIVSALSQAKSLPEAKPNAIYSDILGKIFVHYNVLTGWGLLVVVGIISGVALIASLKTHPITLSSWIKAKSGGMVIMLLSALYLWMIGHVFSAFDHGQKLTHFPFLFGGTVLGLLAIFMVSVQQLLYAQSRKLLVLLTFIMLGVDLAFGFDLVALGLAAASLLIIVFTGQQKFIGLVIEFQGKPALDLNTLWRFSLVLNLFLATLTQVFAAEAAPVILWPLMLSAVAAIVHFTICRAKASLWSQIVFSLLAIIAIGQVGALGVTLYEALGVDMPLVLMVVVLVLLPNILPLFIAYAPSQDVKPFWELNLAVVSFMVLAYAYLAPPSEKFPQATAVVGVESAGQAYLVSGVDYPDKWVRSILGKAMQHSPVEIMGKYPQYWTKAGPSQRHPLKANIVRYGDLLAIHAAAPAGVKRIGLHITPDTDVTLVAINGLALSGTLKANQSGYYQAYLPDDKGITIVLRTHGKAKVKVVTQAISDQWPLSKPLPPMPSNLMASGLHGYGLAYEQQTFAVN